MDYKKWEEKTGLCVPAYIDFCLDWIGLLCKIIQVILFSRMRLIHVQVTISVVNIGSVGRSKIKT